MPPGKQFPPVGLKQSDRGARFEAAARLHLGCHHLPVWRHVEQFLAVLAPPRLLSSRARHLPLAVATGITLSTQVRCFRAVRKLAEMRTISGIATCA